MALPNDLVAALLRNGNRPLPVEDPQSHRKYLIVPADEGSEPEPAGVENHGEWSEAKNVRRFELIDKQLAGSISSREAIELATLQREIDRFLARVAPLPIAAARQLHQQLMSLACNQGSSQ